MDKITRNFKNVEATINQTQLVTNFNNMLNKVNNLIKNEGSVTSVWISFQVGDKSPIYFNTASTDIKENLIANLTFEKTCSGEANVFTLTVQYDPYNHGQFPSEKLEALDDLLAKTMNYNVDNDNFESIKSYLQYGYNSSLDENIVSPKYCCLLLKADSEVDYGSGLITYTFEGTSAVAPDSNFTASFDKIDEEHKWKVLDLVKWILYYYYGDENNPPEGYDKGLKTFGGTHIKYRIDIPQELIDDSPEIAVDAVADMNPIQYCKSLLKDKVAVSDMDKEFDPGKKPQYILYETSVNGSPTFHISYCSPINTNNNLSIPYIFTWNNTSNNIVVKWKPEVNLYNYMILKCQRERELVKLQEAINNGEITNTNIYQNYVQTVGESYMEGKSPQEIYKEIISALANQNFEYYNAELTLQGIPCDPPISAQIKIIPITLESVSRTAGWYTIQKATDTISTNGLFITTLKLFRSKGLYDTDSGYTISSQGTKNQESGKSDISNNNSSTNFTNGGGGGGRW